MRTYEGTETTLDTVGWIPFWNIRSDVSVLSIRNIVSEGTV